MASHRKRKRRASMNNRRFNKLIRKALQRNFIINLPDGLIMGHPIMFNDIQGYPFIDPVKDEEEFKKHDTGYIPYLRDIMNGIGVPTACMIVEKGCTPGKSSWMA